MHISTRLWPLVALYPFVGGSVMMKRAGGSMAIENLKRTCTVLGTSCTYDFIVDSNPTPTGPGTQLTPCKFTVTPALSPTNLDEPNYRYVDFHDMHCDNSDIDTPSRWLVNGGWSQNNFIVIVVNDTQNLVYAFFGFTAASPDFLDTDGHVCSNHTEPTYDA